jgi:3-oxoacyl-[acyl-carrier protein] reductase
MSGFEDKTVVITGGSPGIGLATARAFLEKGAKVAICAQHPERLAAAARELEKLGEVMAFPADVREFGVVKLFIDEALEHFGAVDVLVNNAGRLTTGDFAGLDLSLIDEVLDTNIKGVVYPTRLVLPHMLARGAGVVVNIASGLGKAGLGGVATYSASKFAVVGFTESVAQEVEGTGVKVYAICPGRVATDMQVQYSGEKVGTPPETVAANILALAGARPPVRSGECLQVWGS